MPGKKQRVIGLCGGVGAGKSTVAAAFERAGCLVVSSDQLNHVVLRRPEVLRQLQEWWGPEVIDADGGPNRARIAEIVFSDEAGRRRLESLLYPLIAVERQAIIRGSKSDPTVKAIILDSPLLFESNLDRLCDKIVFVDASEERRLERLRRARQWDPSQLERRERWQHPLARKRKRSDYVISNEGSIEQLRQQVIDILEEILA